LLDVSRQHAIKLAHGPALLSGVFAIMLTRTGTHADRPYGCAWTRLKPLARAAEGGTWLAILRTVAAQGTSDPSSSLRPADPGGPAHGAGGSTALGAVPVPGRRYARSGPEAATHPAGKRTLGLAAICSAPAASLPARVSPVPGAFGDLRMAPSPFGIFR
jgi:hypothetical protein